MSTTATPQPNPILAGIASQIGQYAQFVQPTIQLVETQLAGMPGASKAQAAGVIIQSLAHVGEANANPNVALISALVDIGVSIANQIGMFVHSVKASTTPVVPASTPSPILAQPQPQESQIAQQISTLPASTPGLPSVPLGPPPVAHAAAPVKETFAQESAGDKAKTIGSLGIFHQTAPAPAEVVNPVAATKP